MVALQTHTGLDFEKGKPLRSRVKAVFLAVLFFFFLEDFLDEVEEYMNTD